MARKIIWSPTALSDVETIAVYISRDSEAYAAAVVRRLTVAIERLPRFPRMGRVVPEFSDPDIRELIVQSYRIIYRLTDQSVIIAAVVHRAHLLSNALEGRRI